MGGIYDEWCQWGSSTNQALDDDVMVTVVKGRPIFIAKRRSEAIDVGL